LGWKSIDLSFLTEREKEIYSLVKELGNQRLAAGELGVSESVVSMMIQNMRWKVVKLRNTIEECLELGLLTEKEVEDILERRRRKSR
ncbi:MAG: hypothetical protein ACE5GD_00005, partial [Candidatus Geothermarchaeales archaeon]